MAGLTLSFKPYDLILKYPFNIANYSRKSTPVVLTQLEYDGLIGYGEASLPQYLGETQQSVMSFLRKLDLSQFSDPLEIDKILDYVDEVAEGNTAAKASVDIVLHDLIGKILDKPLHQLWNLNKDDTPYTSYTIGIDNEETIRQKTQEAAYQYQLLKIKLDGKNDRNIIRIVRSVTDLPLIVDANQSWIGKERSLDEIFWLKDNGVILVEQPMAKSDLDNHAWLTERSPIPVFADESVQRMTDLHRIKGAFSGINIKLMKCTGLREAKRMLEIAPSLGFKTMLGCMTETSCAISAAAQLSPFVNLADLDGALLINNDCYDGIKINMGRIILNDRPGIGVFSVFPI